eukprot:2878667-Prymnesium_polylepis.2
MLLFASSATVVAVPAESVISILLVGLVVKSASICTGVSPHTWARAEGASPAINANNTTRFTFSRGPASSAEAKPLAIAKTRMMRPARG